MSLDGQGGGAQLCREKVVRAQPAMLEAKQGPGRVRHADCSRWGSPGAVGGSRAVEPWSSTVVRSQKARLPSVAALHRNSLLQLRTGHLGQNGMQETVVPTRRRAPRGPSPLLARRLVCEGMDLEDTALVVKGFCQELQPPSKLLQKKEPAGQGCSPQPTPEPPTPLARPRLSPHCPIATGCSHQGAEARPVELTHS